MGHNAPNQNMVDNYLENSNNKNHTLINQNIAIQVENLTKIYKLYDRPRDRIHEAFHPFRKKFHRDFYALNDVSFELKKGENLGILGKNGSGKSTLLKIITGVLTPSSGSVRVNGRISSLLELGTGFNPDLTGIENIYFYGLINGLQAEEVEKNIDSILGFADIGPFVHQPVKSYSSGMFVRLAFACAIQIEPEIFIVDEALSVGDAKFQAKSFAKIKKMIDSGCTFIFVSHSTEQIVSHCETAIFLKDGRIHSMGEPKTMVNLYLDDLFGKGRINQDSKLNVAGNISNLDNKSEAPPDTLSAVQSVHTNSLSSGDLSAVNSHLWLNKRFEDRKLYNPNEYRWGDGKVAIRDFVILEGGVELESGVEHGKTLELLVLLEAIEPVQRPILGLAIKTREGVTIYNSNTKINGSKDAYLESLNSGEKFIYHINFSANLGSGDYFLSLGLASESGEGEIVPHDRRYDSIHLNIYGGSHFYGISNVFADFSQEKV